MLTQLSRRLKVHLTASFWCHQGAKELPSAGWRRTSSVAMAATVAAGGTVVDVDDMLTERGLENFHLVSCSMAAYNLFISQTATSATWTWLPWVSPRPHPTRRSWWQEPKQRRRRALGCPLLRSAACTRPCATPASCLEAWYYRPPRPSRRRSSQWIVSTSPGAQRHLLQNTGPLSSAWAIFT